MQLQQHPPTAARRLAGRVFVSMLVFAAGCGALASKAAPAQGASKTSYLVAMKLSVNGGESAPRLHVKEGEPFALTMDDKGGQWRGDFVLARAGTRQVTVKGEVKMDGRTIAAPSVLVALDEPAAIGMTDAAGKPSRLEFTVSELPAADQADKRP